MATTIIAIYGAVLATLSTLLGAWYYLHSGPRLQAEAVAFYPLDEDDYDDWPVDKSFIMLKVWNTGRADITVHFRCMMLYHGISLTLLPLGCIDYDGPEEPIRILGHSNKKWKIHHLHHLNIKEPVTTSGTLTIKLEAGGNREIDVPVFDGMMTESRRPFILDTVPCKSRGFLSCPPSDLPGRRSRPFRKRL
jgi:hypothetical protein